MKSWPECTYAEYLRQNNLVEPEDNFEAKAFMSHYNSSMRQSRFGMIIVFVIGGLLMLCGIAKLLLAFGIIQ